MENHMWFSSCWEPRGWLCQLGRPAAAWKTQVHTAQGTTALCGLEQLTPLVKSRPLGCREGDICRDFYQGKEKSALFPLVPQKTQCPEGTMSEVSEAWWQKPGFLGL